LQELPSQSAELFSTVNVEKQYGHVRQEIVLDTLDDGRRVLSVVSPSVKLSQNDGGDVQTTGVLREAVH
jgi:hypothetical protein